MFSLSESIDSVDPCWICLPLFYKYKQILSNNYAVMRLIVFIVKESADLTALALVATVTGITTVYSATCYTKQGQL